MIHPDKEAEWDAWERRNPGVAHSDRIKYRNEQGRKHFLEDWDQGTSRFHRDTETFAERARRSRMGM
jgi:hypothetical protein